MGMATCKDCLHIDVCYMVEHYGVDIYEDRQEYDCHKFKAAASCVEVVRCKDCKYYEIHRPKVLENCERNGHLIPMSLYDFCSYGERREGE